jgi:O-antigen/teichoic acid export membrane protein
MSSRKIVLDGMHLGGARVFTLLLSIGTTYITARVLGPRDFGLLAAFNLVPQLATYGSLGWDSASTRELPHLLASGAVASATKSRRTAFTAELITAGIWALVAMIVAIFVQSMALRIGVLLGGVSVVIGKLMRLLAIDAFVVKDFAIQARVSMITAAASAVSQVAGAWWFGAEGAFGGVVLASGIGLAAFWHARGLHLEPGIDRAEMARLTRIGLPMAVLGLLSGTTGATVYLERTLIGGYAGLGVLGLYVFAGNLNNYLVSFIGDFSRTWQPHLFEAMARDGSRQHLERWLARPGLALALASAALGTCMLAAVPVLVLALLPAYTPVIPVLPILFFAGLVNCLTYVPGNFLNSAFANRQIFYTGLWAAAIALFGATLWGVVWSGGQLYAIAAVASVPPLVVVAIALPATYAYYLPSVPAGIAYTARLIAPIVYVVAVHGVARATLGHALPATLASELLLAAITLTLTLVPLAWLAWSTFEGTRLWRAQFQVP